MISLQTFPINDGKCGWFHKHILNRGLCVVHVFVVIFTVATEPFLAVDFHILICHFVTFHKYDYCNEIIQIEVFRWYVRK